jgi:group I intron endonuclease
MTHNFIIYIIKNKVSNKVYIGQTIRTLNGRKSEYKLAYKNKKFHNPYLKNSFMKYGWDSFEFSILDTANTIDELNEKEIYYIQYYKSNQREYGYNITSGGRNAIPTIETLHRMAESHRGIKQTTNWIKNRIHIAGSDDAKKYGKKKTIEERKLLSINSSRYWLGKVRDDETKQKISKTKLSLGLSDKQKEVLCKKVYRVELSNNVVTEFESTVQASIVVNVNQSTISRWCSKNKIINGFLWRY